MVMRNELLAEIGGAGVGALQTPLLRQYADPEWGVIINPLKAFGTPSALAGIGLGGAALLVALWANAKRKLTDVQISALETYGAAALVGGIASGVWPAISVATTSMEPGIQTAARTYVPPLNPSYNRMDSGAEAVQRMAAEIQRLSGVVNTLAVENQQLKTMQLVSAKQKGYSFMDPGAQVMVPPGQPMRGAKDIGFMDGMPPLAKIQNMKNAYGFLG